MQVRRSGSRAVDLDALPERSPERVDEPWAAPRLDGRVVLRRRNVAAVHHANQPCLGCTVCSAGRSREGRGEATASHAWVRDRVRRPGRVADTSPAGRRVRGSRSRRPRLSPRVPGRSPSAPVTSSASPRQALGRSSRVVWWTATRRWSGRCRPCGDRDVTGPAYCPNPQKAAAVRAWLSVAPAPAYGMALVSICDQLSSPLVRHTTPGNGSSQSPRLMRPRTVRRKPPVRDQFVDVSPGRRHHGLGRHPPTACRCTVRAGRRGSSTARRPPMIVRESALQGYRFPHGSVGVGG